MSLDLPRMRMLFRPTGPANLDWDFWVGPAPWRPYSSVLAPPIEYEGWARWRYFWDFGGGGMTDWGAHHFDIGQWGMGADETGPVEIHPPNGKDVKVLTYRYANGVVMTREEGVNGLMFTGATGEVEVNRLSADQADELDAPASKTGRYPPVQEQ